MNIISAIIDSILGFIHRNPLTTIVLVMLLVFAPSVFGAIFIGILALALIILAVPLANLSSRHARSLNNTRSTHTLVATTRRATTRVM